MHAPILKTVVRRPRLSRKRVLMYNLAVLPTRGQGKASPQVPAAAKAGKEEMKTTSTLNPKNQKPPNLQPYT